MIQIAEFLEREISWIDFIVLNALFERHDMCARVSCRVSHLAARQTEFVQNFKYTLLRSARGERLADAKHKQIPRRSKDTPGGNVIIALPSNGNLLIDIQHH